jgi:hypothetical protein
MSPFSGGEAIWTGWDGLGQAEVGFGPIKKPVKTRLSSEGGADPA